MAIQPMALEVRAPNIDPQAFQNGQAAAIDAKTAQMGQEKAALEQWAQLGLGVMDGSPDGNINMDRLNQVIAMKPDDPIAQHLKANPELLRTITRGSLEVLRYGQDADKFEESKRQFELNLALDTKRVAQAGRGLDLEQQRLDANADGGPETWYGTIGYYKDPKTQQVVAGQYSNKGNFRASGGTEGLTPAVPVQQLDTGTGYQPVTKFGDVPTGAVVTPKNNEQAEYDKTTGKGNAELDVAKPAMRKKAEGALNDLNRKTTLVTSSIDTAISQADSNPLFNTGFLGDLTSAVKGTPAYDLAQTIKTIQANVGFDELQRMRENSPTGGALGQVSDTENQLLQAVQGATAQGQSLAQFKTNMLRVKDLYAQVLTERNSAFARDFGGGSAPAPGAPAQPTTDAEYEALPSGAIFIDPDDGQQYRKP